MSMLSRWLKRFGAQGSTEKNVVPVLGFFYFTISISLILTGFAATQSGDGRPGEYAVVWAIACLSVGMGTGFLFGIPKVIQDGSATSQAQAKTPQSAKSDGNGVNYRQQVNTNLTEISDWLTKIIVGAGLIHLKQIPHYVTALALVLSNSLQSFAPTVNVNCQGLAVAIIGGFSAQGFLFGYLATRLYLAPAFVRADNFEQQQDSDRAIVASLQSEVSVIKEVSLNPESNRPISSATVAQNTDGLPVDAVAAISPIQQALNSAQKYSGPASADYAERVGAKDKAANEIASLILTNAIDRDWLTDAACQQSNDGLIAGLAVAINASPSSRDLARLAKVGPIAQWKHPRYKIAVALGKLFDSRIASEYDVPEASKILNTLSTGDVDDSLIRQIKQTAALIQETTGRSVSLSLP